MTKLISDSLETKLSLRHRLELRFHIMLCSMCRRFRYNIIKLRNRVRSSKDLLDEVKTNTNPMPAEVKARLEEVVKQQLG